MVSPMNKLEIREKESGIRDQDFPHPLPSPSRPCFTFFFLWTCVFQQWRFDDLRTRWRSTYARCFAILFRWHTSWRWIRISRKRLSSSHSGASPYARIAAARESVIRVGGQHDAPEDPWTIPRPVSEPPQGRRCRDSGWTQSWAWPKWPWQALLKTDGE